MSDQGVRAPRVPRQCRFGPGVAAIITMTSYCSGCRIIVVELKRKAEEYKRVDLGHEHRLLVILTRRFLDQ